MIKSCINFLSTFVEIFIILLLLFLDLQNLDHWGIAHQSTQLLSFLNLVKNKLKLIVFQRIFWQD
jgi:cadmium resistance protein CadD (predicted permease)